MYANRNREREKFFVSCRTSRAFMILRQCNGEFGFLFGHKKYERFSISLKTYNNHHFVLFFLILQNIHNKEKASSYYIMMMKTKKKNKINEIL